jgi:hypothetical protein
MHIEHIEVGNFRKLQSVRVDFAEKTTVFVGANNSGKTSAMVALRRFLVDRTEFSINDFTLSNWASVDAFGAAWEALLPSQPEPVLDWDAVLPHLDLWLSVPMAQLHYVQKILPTLDWAGGLIGVRLRFEPRDTEAFRHEYLTARKAAVDVLAAAVAAGGGGPVSEAEEPFALWPRSMIDFLSVKLRALFEVKAYLLDPSKLEAPESGIASPQALPAGSEPIEGDPLKRIIRIDEISAQRDLALVPALAARTIRTKTRIRRAGRSCQHS